MATYVVAIPASEGEPHPEHVRIAREAGVELAEDERPLVLSDGVLRFPGMRWWRIE